ncbi:hypothetical protein [Haloferax chudinovii]|uniref:DUF340 domain-containing protein n=1 Tax=Haloferax chudinovii TaxID=1109010 RepID=A0ABD5XED9_9EURY
MSMSTPEFSVESLKMLLVVAFLTLTANLIATGTGFVAALPGMALIVLIGLVALLMGRLIPLDLPAFAYAMILAFALALPFSPVQAPFLAAVGEVDFLATTTPILAYAGLSIGLQTGKMKEVSWKLVVVAVFVFFGTFFGSALISQAVLSAQGII